MKEGLVVVVYFDARSQELFVIGVSRLSHDWMIRAVAICKYDDPYSRGSCCYKCVTEMCAWGKVGCGDIDVHLSGSNQ